MFAVNKFHYNKNDLLPELDSADNIPSVVCVKYA
jgi:hypothetical protein